MKKLISALVLSLAAFTTVVVAQPTVKEIYQTAQTDKQQALNMINQVVRSHPNSARAYYIQSELLLQNGKKAEAKSSFLKSQQLDPNSSFAKPESVARLRDALGIKQSKGSSIGISTNQLILWGCGILLVILAVIMIMERRKPTRPLYPSSYNLQNRPITPANTPVSAVNASSVSGDQATSQTTSTGSVQASGRSNLMGSLAQGAVMGAGVAAGATLVNHLLNGNKSASEPAQPPVDNSGYVPDNNFGMDDTGGDWGGSVDDSGEW